MDQLSSSNHAGGSDFLEDEIGPIFPKPAIGFVSRSPNTSYDRDLVPARLNLQYKKDKLMKQLRRKQNEIKKLKNEIHHIDLSNHQSPEMTRIAPEETSPVVQRPKTSVDRRRKKKSFIEKKAPSVGIWSPLNSNQFEFDIRSEVLKSKQVNKGSKQELDRLHKLPRQLQFQHKPSELKVNSFFETPLSGINVSSAQSRMRLKKQSDQFQYSSKDDNMKFRMMEMKRPNSQLKTETSNSTGIKKMTLTKYIKSLSKARQSPNQLTNTQNESPYQLDQPVPRKFNLTTMFKPNTAVQTMCDQKLEAGEVPRQTKSTKKNRRAIPLSPTTMKLFDSKTNLQQIIRNNCQKMLSSQLFPIQSQIPFQPRAANQMKNSKEPLLQSVKPTAQRPTSKSRNASKGPSMGKQPYELMKGPHFLTQEKVPSSVVTTPDNSKALQKKKMIKILRNKMNHEKVMKKFSLEKSPKLPEQAEESEKSEKMSQLLLSHANPVNLEIEAQAPQVIQPAEIIQSEQYKNIMQELELLKAQVFRNRQTREVVIQTEPNQPPIEQGSPELDQHQMNLDFFQNSIMAGGNSGVGEQTQTPLSESRVSQHQEIVENEEDNFNQVLQEHSNMTPLSNPNETQTEQVMLGNPLLRADSIQPSIVIMMDQLMQEEQKVAEDQTSNMPSIKEIQYEQWRSQLTEVNQTSRQHFEVEPISVQAELEGAGSSNTISGGQFINEQSSDFSASTNENKIVEIKLPLPKDENVAYSPQKTVIISADSIKESQSALQLSTPNSNQRIINAKTIIGAQSSKLQSQFISGPMLSVNISSLKDTQSHQESIKSSSKSPPQPQRERMISDKANKLKVQKQRTIPGTNHRRNTVAKSVMISDLDSPVKKELPQIIQLGRSESGSRSSSSSDWSDSEANENVNKLVVSRENSFSIFKPDVSNYMLARSQTIKNNLGTRLFHKTAQESILEHQIIKCLRLPNLPFKFNTKNKFSDKVIGPPERKEKAWNKFECSKKHKPILEHDNLNIVLNLHNLYHQLQTQKSITKEPNLLVKDCIINAHSRALIKLQSKYSNTQKLLEVYDLNFKEKLINDPMIERKQERNIRLLQSDQIILTPKEEFKRSIVYKINQYITKLTSLIDPSEVFIVREAEESLISKFRSFKNMLRIQKKQFKFRAVFERVLKESETALKQFIWKRRLQSSDEPLFVRILNIEQLDKLTEAVLLKSLMAKAEVIGVQNYLEWNSIIQQEEAFMNKYHRLTKQQTLKFEKQIHKSFNKIMVSERTYLNVHIEVLKQLSVNQKRQRRWLSMVFKYKQGYCTKGMTNFIVNRIFLEKRYEWIKEQTTNYSMKRVVRNEYRNVIKFDGMKLNYEFSDYPMYAFVTKNWHLDIANMVFNHNKQTIYKYLILPENDVIAHTIITYMYRQACKKFDYKQVPTKGAYNQMFGFQGRLEFVLEPRKSLSAKILTPQQVRRHYYQTGDLQYPEDNQFQKLKTIAADIFPVNRTQQVRKYKRQDANNDFDRQVCEFVVYEILQQTEYKIRDQHLIMYKSPARWIQTKDQVMNKFRQEFCLKSQMIRHLEYPNMLMEMFKATNVHQTLQKLVQNQKPQSKKKAKSFKRAPTFLEIIEDDKVVPKPPPLSKELQSVIPGDFLTDDSMRDIDFQDVKSDQSLSNESNIDKDSQYSEIIKKRKMSILNIHAIQSPLKYYQNLSKQHIEEKKKQKMKKMPIFEMVTATQMEKLEVQRRERTLMDINLTFVDELMYIKNEAKNEIQEARRKEEYFQLLVQKCYSKDDSSIKNYSFCRRESSLVRRDTSFSTQSKQVKIQAGSLSSTQVQRTQASMKFKGIMNKIVSMSPSLPKKSTMMMDEQLIDQVKSFQRFKLVNTMRRVRACYNEAKLDTGNELKILEAFDSKKMKRRDTIIDKRRMCKHHQQKDDFAVSNRRRLFKNLKLQRRMKSVTDRLGVKFLLDLPHNIPRMQSIFFEKRQFSKDPEIQKVFKTQIFKIFLSKNYGKIEDIFKRYFITSSNLQTDNGDSLIAMAVHMADEQLVRMCILRGMDPNTQNINGDTPLHHAINMMNLKIADLLIDNGADETIKNNQGNTPWDMQQGK